MLCLGCSIDSGGMEEGKVLDGGPLPLDGDDNDAPCFLLIVISRGCFVNVLCMLRLVFW